MVVVVRLGKVGHEAVTVMHGDLLTMEQIDQIVIADVIVLDVNTEITFFDTIDVLLANELMVNLETAAVLEGFMQLSR